MAMDLTHEKVRALFDYDAKSGILVWQVRPRSDFKNDNAFKRWNTSFAGKEAGYIDRLGYRRFCIANTPYPAHRVIWFYVHGRWPDNIDHINGNPSDNRLSNLRSVTDAVNAKNKSQYRNNSSGFRGVSWKRHEGTWYAYITISGRMKSLGRFVDKADAIAARKTAERQYGFHPNHGREA